MFISANSDALLDVLLHKVQYRHYFGNTHIQRGRFSQGGWENLSIGFVERDRNQVYAKFDNANTQRSCRFCEFRRWYVLVHNSRNNLIYILSLYLSSSLLYAREPTKKDTKKNEAEGHSQPALCIIHPHRRLRYSILCSWNCIDYIPLLSWPQDIKKKLVVAVVEVLESSLPNRVADLIEIDFFPVTMANDHPSCTKVQK